MYKKLFGLLIFSIVAYSSFSKTAKRFHPYHWFDGFMDDIEIELKEFG
jgi:hypothetical protein